MSDFVKYRQQGSYHWTQTNPAAGNDQFNAPLTARYQALLKHIPPHASTGLDIGCGDGYLLHLLLRHTNISRLVGVDSTALGVHLAQTQLKKHTYTGRWHLLVDSAYTLSFPDSRFDCILMADVIEHLDSPEDAVTQATRLLNPGGVFILSTPNWQPDLTWDRLHVQEFTPDQLKTLLLTAFSDVTLFGCWPMTYFRLWKRNSAWRKILQGWSRLGYNPFEPQVSPPSLAYGQLVAVCRK